MKKVLFVHDGPRWKNEYGEQFGTAADVDMFGRYQYLGDKVEFMMRVFKSDQTSSLINLNKIGLYINEIAPFNRPKLLLNFYKSKKAIINQVDNADIVVVRLPSTIGSVALKHAKKSGKPYIVEVVACPWDTLTNHGLLGKLYSPFSRKKLKKLVADAPFVIYVTKYFLQSRYPTKYESTNISNVILRNFPERNNKEMYYENFSKDKKIIFTTLGVVNLNHKGHHYVLKAMVTLVKEGYDVHYNMVGGGDNKRLLKLSKELGLSDRVSFPGKIPHHDVFEILEKTDLYLQPSDAEGLPRALIEAMSRGCAAIGSNVAGIPELLDNSAIFKTKNVKDLTDKIRYLLDKEKLVSHSRKNYELAREYSFENLETRRKAFFDKFLNSIDEK